MLLLHSLGIGMVGDFFLLSFFKDFFIFKTFYNEYVFLWHYKKVNKPLWSKQIQMKGKLFKFINIEVFIFWSIYVSFSFRI